MRTRHVKTIATLGLLLTAVALAGCLDSGDPEPSGGSDLAAPPTFTEDTGAIEGLVLDPEGMPIAGAMAGLLQLDLATTSNAQGQIRFNEVPPGNHQLFVQRLGYDAHAQRVAVTAGEATRVDIVLEPIRLTDPFTMQRIEQGLVGCGVSVRPVVGVAVCGVLGLQSAVNTSQYDKFLLRFPMEEPPEDWQTGVMEMTWQSNQAVGRGLSLNWEVMNCPNNNNVAFGRIAGENPLQLRQDREDLERVINNAMGGSSGCGAAADQCNEERCNQYTRVFATAATTGLAADVGVVFQQRFTQYWTMFFGDPAPEGYSALEDR